MSSLTTNPSIDQGALLNFQDSFYQLAQQTKSKLQATGAIDFVSAEGKTTNMARIGRIELTEVNTRNPDKQFGDYSIDNRQFQKRRFTKTITIDSKYDINEMLKDPTSDILTQLSNAKERVIDRIAIACAVGPVSVGAPDAAQSTITAAQDGVVTIDATAGVTYQTVMAGTENFINNDVPMDVWTGSTLCITGRENTNLMNEVEFINNQYMTSLPQDGVISKAGAFYIALFAGSTNGGVQVINPILPEGLTTRQCVLLAPKSIIMAMELALLDVQRSSTKVNSWDLTIDFWINGMRAEGAKVQIITTTL